MTCNNNMNNNPNNNFSNCLNNDLNSNIINNMNNYGYNVNNLNDDLDCNNKKGCNNNSCNLNKRKLMNLIRQYSFSIVDLSQYLDTHPCDQKAIMIHKEYCEKLRELKGKYEKEYGPLTIYSPQNSWKWIEDSWPWEKGGV